MTSIKIIEEGRNFSVTGNQNNVFGNNNICGQYNLTFFESEVLKQENIFLKKVIKEKDKIIEEKERLIGFLLSEKETDNYI